MVHSRKGLDPPPADLIISSRPVVFYHAGDVRQQLNYVSFSKNGFAFIFILRICIVLLIHYICNRKSWEPLRSWIAVLRSYQKQVAFYKYISAASSFKTRRSWVAVKLLEGFHLEVRQCKADHLVDTSTQFLSYLDMFFLQFLFFHD